MIDVVVRSFIGDLGGRILDFYLEYSLIINGIILLYFVFILIGRRNYSVVLDTIVSSLIKNHENQLRSNNPKQLSAVLKRLEIPWSEGIDSTYFPTITPAGSYRPYLKNEKNLQKLYTNEILANSIISSQNH